MSCASNRIVNMQLDIVGVWSFIGMHRNRNLQIYKAPLKSQRIGHQLLFKSAVSNQRGCLEDCFRGLGPVARGSEEAEYLLRQM